MSRNPLLRCFVAAALLLSAPALWAAATIVVVNRDGANEGFNDSTPAAPVGGNPGTTIGQQRLIAFQQAAGIWGSKLTSAVPIYIQATFDPLTCTATGAVLGAAGVITIWANSPGVEFANTWYPAPLANRLAGVDLAPGPNGTIADDIQARFNSNLGNPGCLTGIGWYYGLDGNHGTQIDLVTVLLHEFGHGLGFATFVNGTTGARLLNLGDVYAEYTRDITTGKKWNAMTNPEIVTSAKNFRKVVWDGVNVTGGAPAVLLPGTPLLKINSPAALAGDYMVGAAAFGPPLGSPGITAGIVQALDLADVSGPLTTDGCSALTNAAAIAGKIALIDRGTCGLTVKVKNAQNAGAVAVLIANNVAGSPPPALGGSDPTIFIPAVGIIQADATAIKAQLGGGVNGTLRADLTLLQGLSPTGHVLLFTPNPFQPGSSVSHFDTSAYRNLLMEPSISGDLTHNLEPPFDLTLAQMTDIGWLSDGDGVPDGRDLCLNSDRNSTVIIQGCNSGVPDTLFASGCKISDAVKLCAKLNPQNQGQFQSCVSDITNTLMKNGVISGQQKGQITSCSARSSLP